VSPAVRRPKNLSRFTGWQKRDSRPPAADVLTQGGRALRQLGIEHIAAYSAETPEWVKNNRTDALSASLRVSP
jgi:hypothetical protein